jgi:CHAD domain-containing protein
LRRIRKGAGKVRDVEVQLAALASLKIALEPRRKRQFTQGLLELRRKHESRLRKLLKKSDIRQLRKRLARAAEEANFEARIDPLRVAREMLESVLVWPGPADETTLDRYRMVVKRARYAAEFAPASAPSKLLIAQLKRQQDAIGHWHDWFMLTQTAANRLGDVTQSALVAALHAMTRAKFRQAVAAVSPAQAAAPGAVEPKSSTASALPAERPGAAA